MATNVVLVVLVLAPVVVVIRFSKYYNFSISQPIVIKLCTPVQVGDSIIHNRTVSNFQVKS